MNRLVAFLSKEIIWGRLAGIALAASLLSEFLSSNVQSEVLGFLPLVTFAVGAIIVGNMARRHPFWNGFFYGILCIVFSEGLVTLYRLGADAPFPPPQDLGLEVLSMTIIILPQVLAGAWIAVSFRRIREMGQDTAAGEKPRRKEAQAAKQAPGKKRAGGEPKEKSRGKAKQQGKSEGEPQDEGRTKKRSRKRPSKGAQG